MNNNKPLINTLQTARSAKFEVHVSEVERNEPS